MLQLQNLRETEDFLIQIPAVVVRLMDQLTTAAIMLASLLIITFEVSKVQSMLMLPQVAAESQLMTMFLAPVLSAA